MHEQLKQLQKTIRRFERYAPNKTRELERLKTQFITLNNSLFKQNITKVGTIRKKHGDEGLNLKR